MKRSRTNELDEFRSDRVARGRLLRLTATVSVAIVSVLLLGTGPTLQAADAVTGSAVGWGWDDSGQATPPTDDDIIAISAGGIHSLALMSDGSIVGWGVDLYDLSTPPAGNDFVAISAGFLHNLALKTDGSIVGWGDDSDGQSTPPAGNDFIAVSAGAYYSLALKSDGSIVSWGSDTYAPTPPIGNDFVAIDAGFNHSVALKRDGSIVGMGNNLNGKATPPAGNDFVAVAAGSFFSLALKRDGSIVHWGWDDDGQAIPPSGHDYVAICSRDRFGLALKHDGTVVAWGHDSHGETDVPAGRICRSISAGYGHALAMTGEPLPLDLKIVQPPQSYTAAPGSTAVLEVKTSRIPGETYEWKKGDTVVGDNSPTLTFPDVQTTQSGQYSVTVTAEGASETSRMVTLGVKAPPYDTERLSNISTRGQILTGSKIMIAGFVLEGFGQKEVLIRGIGPTLGDFGVTGTIADPKLELFRSTSPPSPSLAINELWGSLPDDIPSLTQRVGGFALAEGSKDAVITLFLEPGAYTAQVSGLGGTGIGLVELYDADPDPMMASCSLANISTRGEVGSGAQMLIAGFVVSGDVPKQTLIRGIGPRLAEFGVDGTLVDPYLQILKNANPEPLWVASNDDWSESLNSSEIIQASAAVGAFSLSLGSKDAVILTWLEPGAYTAQLSGLNGTTGVALVEVYEVK